MRGKGNLAKFCGKCGSRLDENTGLCPNCDALKLQKHYNKIKETGTPVQEVDIYPESDKASDRGNIPPNGKVDKQGKKKELKEKKKAVKKQKRAKRSTGKKVRRFFLKLILVILLLLLLVTGVAGTLVYFDVVDIPFLSEFNQNNLLEIVNERNITVEEENIVMASETEGTATILVTLPDYELLFKNAVTEENPDRYLLKALLLKDYETQEFEMSANVTVENGKRIVHSDEVVHQLLEESLIKAINALSEVK